MKAKTIKEFKTIIEALSNYYPSLIDAGCAARHYKEMCQYVNNIFTDFNNIAIEYSETQIKFRYYKGRGKDMIEGGGKCAIDEYGITVLIPELQRIAEKYNKRITCTIPLQMVA